MKKKIAILFCIMLSSSGLSIHAQNNPPTGFYVTLKGYMFFTSDGLFFQPLADEKQNRDFVSSLDKTSFKISENTETFFSDVVKGVGKKLIVKRLSDYEIKQDSTLKIFDTINYFKCSIYIYMNFFVKNEVTIDKIGYGFFNSGSLIYYGNLSIRNELEKIIPEESDNLKQLYNSYIRQRWRAPEWLKTAYNARIKKRK